ncbi:hypothetical protein H257_00946 [Aphanomyces astaci]|uniref:Uncharacterized protein n=2 Tax=Aphanomyces astaci TaxID=112090 RepID=W4H6X6_APHAT|nr:hypothetical protein H257_00946 [Aphanomyces astaci]ETV87331.1 hypothetical protein H257_00946 [Aphanomyces astaci]KAF0754434.1 hypothetical protein AaE_005332 [Aphanomyces astaci]RHY88718.1 hypothetical protein DYB35_008434 [Aphanomyces astaci]RQM28626.1 hypothetical protein B5M09_007966 [Aphanomyces astaci]|eukprot:XP_009822194.1 hypothetical protein H257_00946 [Aphanomyces astaci]
MSKWVPYKPLKLDAYLSPELRDKLRKLLVFNVQTGLDQDNQSPSASQNFRYPSPASVEAKAHIPNTTKKNLYSTQYYTRDARRHAKFNEVNVGFHPSLGVKPLAQLPADTPLGSPGNKNPAVLIYDPTGTRSAMSTTHAARDALIEATADLESSQCVKFEWEGSEDAIIAEYELNGTPPVPGRPFPWDMPAQSRIERW